MLTSFLLSEVSITIVVVAYVFIITEGSFRTDGQCDAFSAGRKYIVRARQQPFSTEEALRISTDVHISRSLKPRAVPSYRMISSNMNNEKPRDEVQSIVQITNCEDEVNNLPINKDLWNAYSTMMEEIMTQRRVIKKIDNATILRCRDFLLSHEQRLSPVPDIMVIVCNDEGLKREGLELLLKQQAKLFQKLYDFTSAEAEFIKRCLVYMGDACAKLQSKMNKANGNDYDANDCNCIDPRLPIAVAWQKLKGMGCVMRESSMSTYMYILGNNGLGNLKNDAFVDNALIEVVSCHDIFYKPSEKTLTIRLKSLIARGKIDEAEDIITASFDGSSKIGFLSGDSTTEEVEKQNEHKSTEGRLRTYMPLMEHYCTSGNLTSILRLYRQMQDSICVYWDVESYSFLLSSLARFGYFFGDNDVQGNEMSLSDNENSNFYGSNLFDILVSDMANDVLELTEESTIEMINAFQIGIENHLGGDLVANVDHDSQSLSSKALAIDRVEISKDDGTCPSTGVKLRLLALDESQRQHVHDTLLDMSRTTTEEFIAKMISRRQKPKKNKMGKVIQDAHLSMESYGYEELLKFSKWLNNRDGNLFTAIVDGANVAYYGHSNVHYSSLKKVVQKLESMGERPLVVMPEKYTSRSFACRPNFYQELTRKDQEVIDWLRENEMMYIVPRLNLDDYFWMLASVSNQTNASRRDDLNIPIGDDQGRFPGMRPMLVTNDQMRDHKPDLLEAREFRRWSSCHIVNYDIAFYENDEWGEDRQISFVPADSFSREIQLNPHKNGKHSVWHFPIYDSAEWLCIMIKK